MTDVKDELSMIQSNNALVSNQFYYLLQHDFFMNEFQFTIIQFASDESTLDINDMVIQLFVC